MSDPTLNGWPDAAVELVTRAIKVTSKKHGAWQDRDPAVARAVLNVLTPHLDRQAIRNAALEEAAYLIEQFQPSYGSDQVYMRPRIDGNRDGLAYADAIRALIHPPGDGRGRMTSGKHAHRTDRQALAALDRDNAALAKENEG